jgi:putative DNA primase/helicase
MSAVDSFRGAMHAAGLYYAGPIDADGKLRRFRAGDDKSKNSWYVLFVGPPIAGAFGCWKRNTKESWCEKSPKDYTAAQWREIQARWKQADIEREQVERIRRERAQKTAAWIFDRAKPVRSHPYLERKAVRAYGALREYRGALALPLRDSQGELRSIQFIDADGGKKFLTGGRVAGCFFTVADKSDGPLVIVEGLATGASVFEATGFATVAAMNCGNLLPVAEALRTKWPERDIILAADSDQWTDGNPGLTKAAAAARAIGAKLAVPKFKDCAENPTDFNDLQTLEGVNTVKDQIEAATTPIETDEETFARLAALPPAEYDRCRDSEAKRLKIRVGTLDGEIEKRRPKNDTADSTQGSKVAFPDIEPWPHEVNGSELLNEIAVIIGRFVVASESAIIAASLFVLHTYAFDLGEISPILFITGPTKRCGKSRLLAILLRMVFRPFAAASATPAGIYRTIELHHPTLCIDEVDAFMRGDEQLRGLVNSGHTREAAFHLGCAPTANKEFEPRRWSTWTPKIFSGIGRLADTIEDRAIILKMVRKRKKEVCERLRHGTRFDDIPRKALRFVIDHTEVIRNGNPSLPAALNDRAGDNWTPLLVLADQAGGDWPAKARQAALALTAADDSDAQGIGEMLLADIGAVFATEHADKLPSAKLAEALAKMEGRPWAEFGRTGKPITASQLARQLHQFEVRPGKLRIGNETPNGYLREDFNEAFARYLPLSKWNTGTTPENIDDSRVLKAEQGKGVFHPENTIFPNKNGLCSSVPVANPQLLEQEVLL